MSEIAAPQSLYADTYTIARGKFLTAAGEAGAAVTTHVQPDQTGADGGSLCIDVACLGPRDASRVLLVTSGTHGPEGFAGSAGQIALLRSTAATALPKDVRIVLVHGVNAYGFARITRTTENNVDLNRNFIDFAQGLPENPTYRALHDITCLDEWTEAARAEGQRHTDNWVQAHGFPAWIDAMSRGQYHEPEGLNYGGSGREWPNRTLEAIVSNHVAGAAKVAFIDWHTGLGEYGQPFFLCFNEPDGALWRRCAQWWGADRLGGGGGFDGAARPKYTGLLFHGVQRFVAPAALAGAVIEFGTGPISAMFDWLRADRWLRYGKTPDDPAHRARLHRDLQDAYCPPDPAWRESVARHALDIQEAALAGLAEW